MKESGVWLSLVERCVRDAEARGSNPLTPTKFLFLQIKNLEKPQLLGFVSSATQRINNLN